MLLTNALLTDRDFDPYSNAHCGAVSRSCTTKGDKDANPQRHRPYAHDSHGYPPVYYKRQWNESPDAADRSFI
jgi:hypothetical protein